VHARTTRELSPRQTSLSVSTTVPKQTATEPSALSALRFPGHVLTASLLARAYTYPSCTLRNPVSLAKLSMDVGGQKVNVLSVLNPTLHLLRPYACSDTCDGWAKSALPSNSHLLPLPAKFLCPHIFSTRQLLCCSPPIALDQIPSQGSP
jgi:hypothetical protein